MNSIYLYTYVYFKGLSFLQNLFLNKSIEFNKALLTKKEFDIGNFYFVGFSLKQSNNFETVRHFSHILVVINMKLCYRLNFS